MNEKQIFIHQLKKKLANLPEKERKKSLAFYSEMIDDAMEDGMSEAEAVKSLGDVNDIARDILSEAPFSSIVKGETQKLKNKCKNSPAFTVLLIVGSPVWLPLLLAAAICVCAMAENASLFISAIATTTAMAEINKLAFSAIAVFASLFISAIAVVVAGIVWVGYSVYFFLTGLTPEGLFVCGAGLAAAAGALLCLRPLKKMCALSVRFMGKCFKSVKRIFVGKGESK